ncbi:MAG: hypothetical protein JXA73_23975 [Acidobacteria bacterium]|nr:hypothetical protein [Acidobacteriota bacterium]
MTVLLVVMFALVCFAIETASARAKYFIKHRKSQSAEYAAIGSFPEDGYELPRTGVERAGKKKNI